MTIKRQIAKHDFKTGKPIVWEGVGLDLGSFTEMLEEFLRMREEWRRFRTGIELM